MVRFSLSPRSSSANPASATDGKTPSPANQSKSWEEYREEEEDTDDETSDEEEDDKGSYDTDTSYSSDEEEDEPPHPLGFPSPESYGVTRFCLMSPRMEDDDDGNGSNGAAAVDDPWWEEEALCYGGGGPSNPQAFQRQKEASYPPMSWYLPRRAVDTPALLRYHVKSRLRRRRAEDRNDADVDGVADLIRAACHIDSRAMARRNENEGVRRTDAGRNMWALAAAAQEELETIRRRMERERRKVKEEQLKAAEGLRLLLQQDEAAARKVLTRERKEREELAQAKAERIAEEKEERERRQQIADEQAAKDAAAKAAAKAKADRAKKQHEERARAKAAELAKKTEHVARAEKLVAKLVDLRASLVPFDTTRDVPEVSKRRLGMKKIVKGKVNTLSHDAGKVQSVAADVGKAIAEAREEDERLKKEGLSSELTRGKRYLVDLLASNVVARAEAETFNGTRGDGFPLAAMLAAVSVEAKDIVPVLAAHIFTVCPTVIPRLPTLAPGASEVELMESLGMKKDEKGEYESFDRFLSRTEGLISITADIMSSIPSNHVLMEGHKGAVEWLGRFLKLLPPAPESPLPLVTAPVLTAFLTGAGHMLANKYPDQFRPSLAAIMDDIVNRLDEGAIGRPSATRLKVLVEGGFDKFKTTLPPGAVRELYDGGDGSGSGAPASMATSTGGTGTSMLLSSGGGGINPFGGQATAPTSTTANPFGSVATTSTGGANPFGQTQSMPQQGTFPTQTTPFGAPTSNQPSNQPSAPFGQPQTEAMQSTTAASPAAGQSSFGMQTVTPSPFGAPSAAPATVQQQQQGMGGTNPFGSAPSSVTPFGVGASKSPFGATKPVTGAGPTPQISNPFGAPTGKQDPIGGGKSTPFGGGQSTPFGGSSGSGFGGFGGGTSSTTQPSPFGGGQAGKSNKQDNRPACKFFAQGRCRNGDSCRFSHSSGGGGGGGQGFGGGGGGGRGGGGRGNTFGGGSFGNSSPFGGTGTGATNPFGGGPRW